MIASPITRVWFCDTTIYEINMCVLKITRIKLKIGLRFKRTRNKVLLIKSFATQRPQRLQILTNDPPTLNTIDLPSNKANIATCYSHVISLACARSRLQFILS